MSVWWICCREKEKIKQREEKWDHVMKLAQSNPAVSGCDVDTLVVLVIVAIRE